MRIMCKILKYTFVMLSVVAVAFGILYGIGTSMLKGGEHFHFLGYKITDNYTNDNSKNYHIGNCIVIESVPEYKIHHDTPIAYYDKEQNLIYIYRVVNKEINDVYNVADNQGIIRPVNYSNVLGKVVEN